ncbi:MAG: helix-turn-helix domain-containing protein [Bacteroidia bacterium]|nr:helix-turn-helix domain-containing protein [Bacteroidia bacterium]
MKTKFTSSDSSILGSTIQAVRKSKGVTQEELGRKVGLGKSSVSKIEKGLTHISAEDASILLEAMGEKLVLSATGIDESPVTKEQKARFITTGVSWFAEENRLSFAKAYQFLLLHKGIDFLESSFRYEQTLPRAVVLNDLTRICANNGGHL